MPQIKITIRRTISLDEPDEKLYSFKIGNRSPLSRKFTRTDLDDFTMEFVRDHIQQGLASLRGPLTLTIEIIPES